MKIGKCCLGINNKILGEVLSTNQLMQRDFAHRRRIYTEEKAKVVA